MTESQLAKAEIVSGCKAELGNYGLENVDTVIIGIEVDLVLF